jgi:hypothetical protein
VSDDEEVQRLEMRVPEKLEAGAYANLLSVWHTHHEFTLDFATTLPSEGEVQPARVVARIKLPPTVMFAVLRTLNENLTMFEQSYGVVSGPPGEEA